MESGGVGGKVILMWMNNKGLDLWFLMGLVDGVFLGLSVVVVRVVVTWDEPMGVKVCAVRDVYRVGVGVLLEMLVVFLLGIPELVIGNGTNRLRKSLGLMVLMNGVAG